MSDVLEVKIPDIGDFDEVDIVEVLVQPGDRVEVDQSLISLESDKASMEVPAPQAGTVQEVKVKAGDKAAEGTVILLLEADSGASGDAPASSEDGASEDATTPPPKHSAAPTPDSQKPAGPQATPSTNATAEIEPAPRDVREAADLHAEVLVLGSGPGGYSAAFRAADLGKKVVLVERYPTLGGVCLNVGCIPSKALLHAAKVIDEAADFAEHGIRFGEPEVDIDALRGWKDSVVGKLTGGIAAMAKARKVEVVHGTGRLTSKHSLEIEPTHGSAEATPKTISFDAAILATGSRVVRLPFLPDDPRVLDSTGALELADIPKKLLILGGGIIGLEMATVYHALGAEITVVELMDSLIPGCDKDLVRPLHKRIAKRYANIYLGTKVTAVEAQKKGLKVTFEGPEGSDVPKSATFDKVLTAVGRRPNGDLLNAEAAGLEVTDRGFVPVDRQLRTNVPNLFAIGDLTGQPMLAHKAVHEGKTAAEVIAGHAAAFDARVIPSVAYTDPEVAWVGLTETQAKQDGTSYEKASFPWSANGRSLALGRSEGSTKLLFDPATDRVLGGGIVGPNAGDLIAEVALAIEMDCEAEDIGLTIHPHPTLSETVAMSAEAFAGTLTDLYLPRSKGRGKSKDKKK